MQPHLRLHVVLATVVLVLSCPAASSQQQTNFPAISQLPNQKYASDRILVKFRREVAANARAAAEAKQSAAEKLLGEQKTLQDKALADLRDTFKALSADALKQTAPEFLRLAEQSFGKLQESAKGDLAQRQEAIKTLVEPLKQQLENYQKRLQQSETAQSSALGEVKKQLESL